MLWKTFGCFIGRRAEVLDEAGQPVVASSKRTTVHSRLASPKQEKKVRGNAYRKDERNATSDSFRTVKVSFGADEQVLLALGSLPREDGSAKEENLDGLARRQACRDSGVVFGDGDLRGRYGGRDGDSGGFLGAFHVVARSSIVSGA